MNRPPAPRDASFRRCCSADMAAFHPNLDALPEEFSVFPLPGALLLPRGKLPLNIFEQRYLALTEDALGAGRMFGMIQPDMSRAPGPNGPALYRVGCLGRLTSFSETDDGRFLIQLTGVARFAIMREVEMRRGYRRVHGDFAAYRGDLDLTEPESMIDRGPLLAALKDYFARATIDANWDSIKRIPDGLLIVTLAMVCPFDPAEKQALLEAASEADRADTLLALLRMGATGPEDTGRRPS